MKTRRALLIALTCGAIGCSAETPDDFESVPWTEASLRRVWGSAANDIWAVGVDGVVLHYDGLAWTEMESGAHEQLNAVSGFGTDCAWAVGHAGTIVKWDGNTWSNISMPEQDEELLGVWVSDPENVYASGIRYGSAFLAQFDGTQWATATLNQAGSLWDVWGSGDSDVWTVGSGRGSVGFLLHYAGVEFDYYGYEGGQLRTIWGTGPDDVFAAGYDVPIQHWDGGGWTVSSEGAHRLFAMWGSSGQDVWAVGFDGAVLHYDGTSFAPIESPTTQHLWGIWGAAADDIWAAGGNGTLLHFDGVAWNVSLRHLPQSL